MPSDEKHWSARVNALHEWSMGYDWSRHLLDLNERCHLSKAEELSLSLPGCPPAFFNGNIEALEPNRWVLVVSINPALAKKGHYPPVAKQDSWGFWCEHNRRKENWNNDTGFFSRMVRLAAA